jgi:sulfate transport system substrate-binding protein
MRKKGRTHAQAVGYLRNLYRHIVSQDKSAREALQTFLAGRGDVLLAYENEAIFANAKGQEVPYVIPKATIRIENPIAVTTTSQNKRTANAFLRFLRTPPAQRIYAENGYRPVVPAAARGFSFPVRPQLFTINSLGGWARVDLRFFNARTGIVTRIQQQRGG